MPTNHLDGAAVAFLVANEGVEQVELTEPWKAVEQAGGRPVLVAPESGDVQAFDHLDKADTFTVDRTVPDVSPHDFVGLVLPGGVANPDQLRTDPHAVNLVRTFVDAGKPVAAICHAPWMLIDAAVARNRLLTSWPSLRIDLRNAGANWVDAEVMVCRNGPNTLITSRNPGDLPAFCGALLEELAGARERTATRS
ncbi:type 1 glutamine amidotransferase domain-containing protein [Rhabdothermincola salaria]|uniref:type 1 glutamine amidotransferase domain-containing protein n=1 Tax=Rhabdothermincola salaria TaxID=2903142 RepID=UPI001E40B409|nr:type 1 glutamine amidotransferase domain-containing protein [Rhabdothermincola salaria]MCD9623273.1 type 1 glutamine amidotransferase [Rhabdothermincola salaria]